ncbi:helix-turn-helix domain-containing protein [Stenotrophomonas maltophilia]|uniref:helix-turn-helix domain-containing protein n=1 Tax=Stenotrophomonas maltophilia group sp. Smal13 TaxID=3377166 RepID=UPI0013108BB3|nr:helix-turn-helix domain-containing protein [Stenotrophomonas maltophilia]EKU9959943.1 helix-turn-helix domain-containing protein [Stenotrophomonas maltophilia]EKU9985613.1 helix-turn-helix domain-containing protein [Stenotrophomonas maltophilia]
MSSPVQKSQIAERLSYNVEEALAVTGLNRNAFYRAIGAAEIKTFKVGRRRMVSAAALRDFIAAKEREAASNAAA